ncbi:DUF2779 domain-containing protein [Ramlibacter sp. XY19]|uniref:DUF2779 domain-containing protein n=1 Tax=Ramlibacter paludis TaxID=2908000 RepID=UPI0023DAB997|nr:DUF2779 domain-containing protein [Ramlibacter paludis]MCG2592991.1 DUF2779 domain-containing protein [Ramlibacter paludis]
MVGPLTKSRFKLAIDCPTKLHYAKSENGYRNQNEGNDFLEALADGGHQVGALAKFRYHPDPYGAGITVDTLVKDDAIRETQAKLAAPGRVVIAEAALAYETYFIRVDVLIRDGQLIELIEVKSKSVSNSDVQKRFQGPEWRPYLYDIAFQTLVAEKVFPGYTIVPKLVLVNKELPCDVEGLHQNFRIVPDASTRSVRVEVASGFDPAIARNLSILREVDVTDVVNKLRTTPLIVAGVGAPHNSALEPFMRWAASIQQQPDAFFGGLTKGCKLCEFRADDGDQARSGRHECWQRAIAAGMLENTGDPTDRRLPLSVEIWGGAAGSKSMAGAVLDAKRAFIFDVQADDVRPTQDKAAIGFTPFERRMVQVEAFRSGPAHVIKEPRLLEMDDWARPLHMIDFETSTAALPFFAGQRPYETVAFQFSHHILERAGDIGVRVRHETQWISVDATTNPNVDFARALRAALMPQGVLQGTVFRYHNHENTVLRGLRQVIANRNDADKQQLLDFIDLVTKPSDAEAKQGVQAGAKTMVDLHRLVQEGYYSKVAGGSISLKYILPAILNEAPGVARYFSQPGLFAGPAVTSKNFSHQDGHVWLQAEYDNNPYKTLPPIFSGERASLNEMLLRLAGDDGEETAINQGGMAMTAWNFTQFADLSADERVAIRDALLRYCELDTLAMVMLVMGLFELRGHPLQLLVTN